MHVRIRCYGIPDRIVAVQSKLMKIEKLKQNIEEKYDITSKSQRLFYGGKLLENNCTLYDYNIKLNDVIQLIVNAEIASSISEESVSIKQNDKQQDFKYIDAESDLYEIEDLVDVKHKKQGKWQEGKIIKIVHEIKSSEDATCQVEYDDQHNVQMVEDSVKDMNNKVTKKSRLNTAMPCLYKIQLDSDDEEEKYYEEFDIRPRSRTAIDINELKVGQKVMVNYNIESPDEKGDWYDFKVEQIKKLKKNHVLVGTLYFGGDIVPQSETKVRVHDKIFAIEEVVPVAHRTSEYNIIMKTLPEKRTKAITCNFCRDESELCRECGCSVCWSKQEPTEIVLCDECNLGYHMKCLQPVMEELPEGDWYCPNCVRDTTSVVAPGASSQPRKKLSSSRDWGRGMACVGKTKTCAMPANHFGSIPGIEVGMCWRFRIQLSESGVHRPPVSGIHGRDVEGAYSIVLSGGYEDDVDNGNEFTYTGSGGRDLSGNKRTAEQSCDQRLTRENRALARNCAAGDVSEDGGDAGKAWRDGKPVRVVRSYKMLRHFPKYAPPEGIRYDGIYKVVKYYQEVGLSGFKVWKYLLRRDDPSPAPWERGAKHFPVIYPDGYLEAQAEKKKVTEKKTKVSKSGKKKVVRNESLPIDMREAPDGTVTNSPNEPTIFKNATKKGKKGAIHCNNLTIDSMSEKVSPNEIITENRTEKNGTLEHNDLTSESSSEVDEVSLDKTGKENNEEAAIPKRSKRKRNGSKSEEVSFIDTEMDNPEESEPSRRSKKTVKKRVLRDRNLISDSVPEEAQVPPKKKRKSTLVQRETSIREGPEKSNHHLRQRLHTESLLSEEERKAIEADTLNAKLWADCLETEHDGKKEFMDFMIQSFNCIICRDILVNPVTTECLHNYCLSCLRMMFRASAEDGDKPSCPCCRHEFSHDATPSVADINLALQIALRTIMPGYDAGTK